ncbi:carbohydrate ABC transporter substrate-binding protein [Clostridiales bacterium FE2010]|nr:carbohydrate ABC transporter substrate-binding protein [Clostridiales bacterium FE2010]
MKKLGMKKLALVLVLVLALCLTGCAGKEAKKQEGFAPKLDTKADCTITVSGHYENFEALETEFNRFAEYYPNVNMKYVYMDDYKNNIATALESSEAPDIFFTYSSWGDAEYAQAENLADPATGIDLSCIRESLLYKDAAGNVPTVPVYTTTYGMLVNEEIFEKNKIAIPKTYDELIAACEALKAAGYASPIMAYNNGSEMLFPMFYPYFCAQIQGKEDVIRKMNNMEEGAGEYMRSALELASDFMSRGYVDLESCSQIANNYEALILRFFEGDVPMMMATGNTVSGTEKREKKSEAFTAHPFKYSYHPVPSTKEGGYFLNLVSIGFAVNKNSQNLEMANEFMRFLVTPGEMNRMAQAKRMVTPCTDMSLDGVYAAFGGMDASRVINMSELGLADTPDAQVRKAGWQVSNGTMTVDEAVAAFGTLQ